MTSPRNGLGKSGLGQNTALRKEAQTGGWREGVAGGIPRIQPKLPG